MPYSLQMRLSVVVPMPSSSAALASGMLKHWRISSLETRLRLPPLWPASPPLSSWLSSSSSLSLSLFDSAEAGCSSGSCCSSSSGCCSSAARSAAAVIMSSARQAWCSSSLVRCMGRCGTGDCWQDIPLASGGVQYARSEFGSSSFPGSNSLRPIATHRSRSFLVSATELSSPEQRRDDRESSAPPPWPCLLCSRTLAACVAGSDCCLAASGADRTGPGCYQYDFERRVRIRAHKWRCGHNRPLGGYSSPRNRRAGPASRQIQRDTASQLIRGPCSLLGAAKARVPLTRGACLRRQLSRPSDVVRGPLSGLLDTGQSDADQSLRAGRSLVTMIAFRRNGHNGCRPKISSRVWYPELKSAKRYSKRRYFDQFILWKPAGNWKARKE